MPLLTPEQALGFLAAASLLTLAPGPDNLLVLALGASRGRRAGMAFGLGCAAGCLSHTLLATLGIGALIAASPLAFGILKGAGGLYLLWLGIQALKNAAPATVDRRPTPDDTPGQLFRRGLIANAINPKVVVFFLAFLPPFVAPGRGDMALQIAQLGLLFTLQAALLFSLIAIAAGRLGGLLARYPGLSCRLERTTGLLFVLLGLHLLFVA
ncbi:LysE family translocator [Dechloromonas sp. ZS-1]|uniref:LysE family translocator n=1 Tax=Dechloromonas sp. ZS-1 TaxID=3138067 RepID=UPI0031FBC002